MSSPEQHNYTQSFDALVSILQSNVSSNPQPSSQVSYPMWPQISPLKPVLRLPGQRVPWLHLWLCRADPGGTVAGERREGVTTTQTNSLSIGEFKAISNKSFSQNIKCIYSILHSSAGYQSVLNIPIVDSWALVQDLGLWCLPVRCTVPLLVHVTPTLPSQPRQCCM